MSFSQGPSNTKKVWAMKTHGSWYKDQSKEKQANKGKISQTLGAFLPEIAQPSQLAHTYTPVETAIISLTKEFILSLDSKSTEEEIELQHKTRITVYYINEWRNLFNTLDTTILKKFIREEQSDKDIILLDIIASMCIYGLVYNMVTIRKIIKPYMDYLYKKNNLHLPKIVVILATPPGKSISNCEEHMKSKLEPNISGKSLIHLFPGESETKIPSLFLIRLLNNLTNGDRIEIAKNLKEWIDNNPDRELVQLLKASSPTPVKIPYYKSICLCKKCKFTVSDSDIDKFLEEKHTTSFRHKNNEFLLKTKPTGNLLTIGKKLLYIQCHSCSSQIAISSIIPKYLDMSKDEKPDEKYKIAEKAKVYLYKIIEKMVESTLVTQFPDFTCCVCLTEQLSYEHVHQNQACKHPPCICLYCNDAKTVQGRAIKGNFYLNSNYQCLGCTEFEPTGNLYIDEFNKTGGVQPGYVGRFCLECIKPFQEKPETCGVEQGNTDISLYCIDCTIQLAEYNKKIRLTVTCPNSRCNTPLSRYDGCDVVECLECNIQFCYGCEYIFINPPDFEWNWTCSCLINNYSRPKQYNDKSQSTCQDRYYAYQERRGIEMPDLLPVPEPEPEPVLPQLPQLPQLPVPVPELPDLEQESEQVFPQLPVSEVIRENININIININYINIGMANPPFQERIIDEEDIQRQILLAENMGDDFSQLY
jgi:hypothetical protein